MKATATGKGRRSRVGMLTAGGHLPTKLPTKMSRRPREVQRGRLRRMRDYAASAQAVVRALVDDYTLSRIFAAHPQSAYKWLARRSSDGRFPWYQFDQCLLAAGKCLTSEQRTDGRLSRPLSRLFRWSHFGASSPIPECFRARSFLRRSMSQEHFLP